MEPNFSNIKSPNDGSCTNRQTAEQEEGQSTDQTPAALTSASEAEDLQSPGDPQRPHLDERELYPRATLPVTGVSVSRGRPRNHAGIPHMAAKDSGVLVEAWRCLKEGAAAILCFVAGAANLPFTCFFFFFVGVALGLLLVPKTRTVAELQNLRDTSVLITGASMGVGESMAYIFASKGAKLFLTSRSEKRLKYVATICEQMGASRVFYSVANMANSTDTEEVAKMAVEKLGNRLDYLVLNHMFQKRTEFWHGASHEMADLRLFLEVNFASYVTMVSILMPSLRISRGRIVVVTSTVSKYAYPHFLVYSASKAASASFFTGLRQELSIKQERISVTIAVLASGVFTGTSWSKDEVAPFFRQDNETAECIFFGAFDRAAEVFCPSWLIWPFGYLLDVPWFKPFLEKILAHYTERGY